MIPPALGQDHAIALGGLDARNWGIEGLGLSNPAASNDVQRLAEI
jgi:hypothetical protein